MKTRPTFRIVSNFRPVVMACVTAATLHLGLLAGSAQTGDYLFSGSEQTITLGPGLYDIAAYGAQGGTYTDAGGSGSSGGLGAEMVAEFNFTTETTLTLLIGGAGGTEDFPVPNSIGGGGGGGSFVANDNSPLIVAGGGGGGGGFGNPGNPGNTGSNGGNGGNASGGTGGVGGTNGNGGAYGNDDAEGDPGAAAGGGGFYSDGGSGGGHGYLNGGSRSGVFGGFGGGGTSGNLPGAGPSGGGGGGGYSGGGGGGYGPGGGGGSYIDSSAIEIVSEVSGIASPDDSPNGEIIITAVPEPGTLAFAVLGGLSLLAFRHQRK